MLARGVPYAPMQTNEVLPFVADGGRLDKPDVSEGIPVEASVDTVDFLYGVMLECWHEDQMKRPKFREIARRCSTFDLDSIEEPLEKLARDRLDTALDDGEALDNAYSLTFAENANTGGNKYGALRDPR
jgi:Protein tyrosine and serine/threonine kinase